MTSCVSLPDSKNISLISPVKSYKNAGLHKDQLLKDNKNKAGIYRLVNNVNGKTYIGSGVNLAKRLASYFNPKELKRNPRPIQQALLKYGHNQFTLEILEYCSKTNLLNREQFYLDLLLPDYNILKYAYSLLGFKHNEESIKKLKAKIISPEHKKLLSLTHKGKLVSVDTRKKLAAVTKRYRIDNPITPEALANIKAKTIARFGVPVSILNTQTNEIKQFTNQTEAGEFLGVSRQAIYNAIKRGTQINKIYLITKK